MAERFSGASIEYSPCQLRTEMLRLWRVGMPFVGTVVSLGLRALRSHLRPSGVSQAWRPARLASSPEIAVRARLLMIIKRKIKNLSIF